MVWKFEQLILKLACDKIKEILYKEQGLPWKGKGKTYICLNQEKLDLDQLNRLVKIKYQIININDEVSK